jgi:hypothetical protein
MTDIYKKRPAMSSVRTKPKKRRRRTPSDGAFDETPNRRRRSRNSGFRRLLHLMRKPHNEKRIWWAMLIAAVILLIVAGIWQFWYVEHVARERDRQNELYQTIQRPAEAQSAAEQAAQPVND